MLITWVPGIFLLLVQVLFAGNFQFLRKNLFLFPAITVAALLQVLLATFTMLALSSLSKSSRSSILNAGIIFFSGHLQRLCAITHLSFLAVATEIGAGWTSSSVCR
jgi:hypothetical protein